jgi:hypothetical protein
MFGGHADISGVTRSRGGRAFAAVRGASPHRLDCSEAFSRSRSSRPFPIFSEVPVGSVIKKRRKRMAKKKHRKLLRKTRHQRRNKK